jgi:hypothetical protein
MLDFDQLLNLASNAMLKNISQLRFLRGEWDGTGRGIERWFQVELMTEINESSNLKVSARPRGTDLQIEDKFVELRCPTDYTVNCIANGFKREPEPHIVLFLAMSSDKFLEKLDKLKEKGYRVSYRRVPSVQNWVIGYLTKI